MSGVIYYGVHVSSQSSPKEKELSASKTPAAARGKKQGKVEHKKTAPVAKSTSQVKASKKCFESIGFKEEPILLGSAFEGHALKK